MPCTWIVYAVGWALAQQNNIVGPRPNLRYKNKEKRMLYSLLKPCLFQLDPERAHNWALNVLKYLPASFFNDLPSLPQTLMGLHFPNPIGLAAGFD